MDTHPLTIVFCCIALFFAAPLCAVAQQPGDVKIEPQSFKTKAGTVYEYDLGTIYVPENRNDSESRVIGIGFARFRSTASSPQAPAMFILPGGPGGSYLARMKSSSSNRERMAEELTSFLPFCDVVYVDQRGFSEHGDVLLAKMTAPKRPTDRAFTEEDWVAAFKTFARETVTQYRDTNVDLRGYTVKECANDVADLRKALGYDKIMLNGTSFGSQWSFAIMRLHPEIVARALLSGVEPLNHGYDMPSYVFAAVQRMWRTIDEDESFKPYLPPGGMAEAARIVIERLERGEFVIHGEAQSNGEKSTIAVYGPADFPWNNPTRILDLYHGHTEVWQRQAERGFAARTQSVPLIGQLIDTSLGVTPERRHRMLSDPATRYLGRGFAPSLATAAIWPSADVGDDFRTPVLSDIPVVFAQGDWDTKTPLENTFEIAPFFVNSRVIVVERGGHGVLRPIAQQLPEVWAEIEEFLRTGDMGGIPARVKLERSRSFRPPRFPAPTNGRAKTASPATSPN